MTTTKKTGPAIVECIYCRSGMTVPNTSGMDSSTRITCEHCGESFSFGRGRRAYLSAGGLVIDVTRWVAYMGYIAAGCMIAAVPVLGSQGTNVDGLALLALETFVAGILLHAISTGLWLLRDIRDRLPLPD